MEFLNFGIILGLAPLITGLVQVFKMESWTTWITRVFTLLVGVILAFGIRQAGIAEVSVVISNPYLAALTGIAASLVAMGLYAQQKTDIVNKIAKSESTVTIPSELVDATKDDGASTSTTYVEEEPIKDLKPEDEEER